MSSLDEQLALQSVELEQQAQEAAAAKDQAEEPKKEEDPVLVAFANLPNAPNPDQVARWKQEVGDVYLMAFEQDEIYVYRPIRRLEYKQLANLIKDGQNSEMFQEKLVEKCLLWPTPNLTWQAAGKAGTIPTLYEVIMQNSNFLNPQYAMQLVRKL